MMGLLFTWVSLPAYANEQAMAIKNIQEIRISLDSVWVVMGASWCSLCKQVLHWSKVVL